MEEDLKTVSELKAAIVALVGHAEFARKQFVEKAEMRTFLREERERHAARAEFERERSEALHKGINLVPAGTYICGDPCYAARDVHDLEHFNKTYYSDDEDEEEDEDGEDEGPPRFLDGTPVTAFNTAKAGPAWFTDTHNEVSVRVNGSVLAIVPIQYNPSFAAEGGVAHVVQFEKPTRCFAERGVVHFGHLAFNTNRPTPVDDADVFVENDSAGGGGGGGGKKRKSKDDRSQRRRRRRSDDDDDDDEEWKPAKTPENKRRRRGRPNEEEDDDAGEAEFEFD
mmetsp:Transcript_15175/g.45996  ORF Transcript_15175/g.45996 Transcript_15175/m.45996 type:complete len:282 (+) Transcript_15175:43-888(+)